jgi:hypothetical protein
MLLLLFNMYMSESMSNWDDPKNPIKKWNKEVKKNEATWVDIQLKVNWDDPLNKKMLEERWLVVWKDGKLYPKKWTVQAVQTEKWPPKITEPWSSKKPSENLDQDPSDSEKSLEEARLIFEQEVNKRITGLQSMLWKHRDSTMLVMRMPNLTWWKMIWKDGEKELSIWYKINDWVKTIYAEKSDGENSIYEWYTLLSDKVIKFTIINWKQEKTVCTVNDMLAFVNSDKTTETLKKLTSFVSGNPTVEPKFLKNESSAIDPLSIYT